jgi:hypothetical protein
MALKAHERKLEMMHLGRGFKKDQLDENDYMITPEVKRKKKLKQKMEEGMLNKFMEKRNRKDYSVNTLDRVKCTEREYISNRNAVDVDEVKIIDKTKIMEMDSDGEFNAPGDNN